MVGSNGRAVKAVRNVAIRTNRIKWLAGNFTKGLVGLMACRSALLQGTSRTRAMFSADGFGNSDSRAKGYGANRHYALLMS